MTQTRGLQTRALASGGGAVRDVTGEEVRAALGAAGYATDEALVAALLSLFRHRIALVDAPPTSMRDQQKKLGRIQKAARELNAALSDYPDAGELMHEISAAIHRTGRPWPGRGDLSRWLVRLGRVEGMFEEVRPAHAYRAAIREARDAIGAAGGNVAVHDTSQFLRFLNALDDAFPALVFPPDTVRTGRFSYVRRALAD